MLHIFSNNTIARITRAGIIASMLAGCAIIPFTADAKPASKRLIEVAQPNGVTLKIQKIGDEYSHYIVTEDGIPVINVDGTYRYATELNGEVIPTTVQALPPSMRSASDQAYIKTINVDATTQRLRANFASPHRQRPVGIAPGEKLATRGPGLCTTTFPSKGEQKGLVVLVEFADKKFKISDPKQYFTDMLNKQGFDEYGGTGSARDWFIQNSDGQFIPEFDVYGPVTLPQKMKYYGGNDRWGNDKAPEMMVIQACEQLNDIIDFNEYDRDHNKIVDNVYVFYAGYGEADYNDDNTIWPHSWDISESTSSSPLLDGCVLDHYACSNELDGTTSLPDGIGTFTHEFSHVLGLPDLYFTGSAWNVREPFTPGEYSILDYGPYNNNGRTPPNYSAYERYALDWMVPEILDTTKNCRLKNIADSNHAYIVKTEKAQEYFLLENRRQTGFDTYIPGHGMLVWHIDVNQKVFDQNEVNNTISHQYVDIVEADGTESERDRQNDTFPSGFYTEFTTSTTPKFQSWAKVAAPVGLYYITEEDSGDITFRAVKPGDDPTVDPDNTESVDNIIAANAPYALGLSLHLEGLKAAANVYDINGTVISLGATEQVELPSAGVYMVITSDATYKILAR